MMPRRPSILLVSGSLASWTWVQQLCLAVLHCPVLLKMNLVKSILEHDNYNNIPSRNSDGKSSERDSDNGLSEHFRVDKGGIE
jgi:hypothetical protein